MFRLKMAFKAALIPAIVGIVAFIIGVVLLVVGVVTHIVGLLIAGILVSITGIFVCVMAFNQGKSTMRAICPECQKFMGNSDRTINYSFECNQYKENYDKQTNKFINITFYYTCTIVCPHCGSTSTFEYKVNAKSAPQADSAVDKYLKGILKIKN